MRPEQPGVHFFRKHVHYEHQYLGICPLFQGGVQGWAAGELGWAHCAGTSWCVGREWAVCQSAGCWEKGGMMLQHTTLC